MISQSESSRASPRAREPYRIICASGSCARTVVRIMSNTLSLLSRLIVRLVSSQPSFSRFGIQASLSALGLSKTLSLVVMSKKYANIYLYADSHRLACQGLRCFTLQIYIKIMNWWAVRGRINRRLLVIILFRLSVFWLFSAFYLTGSIQA